MQPLPEGIYQYKRIEDYGTEDHFCNRESGENEGDPGHFVRSGASCAVHEGGRSFSGYYRRWNVFCRKCPYQGQSCLGAYRRDRIGR